MNVELPNGTIIEGVPEGTTKEQIAQKAIAAGLASPEDFNLPKTSQTTPQQPQMTIDPSLLGFLGYAADESGQWLKQNLDMPGGVAGAIAGAKLGAPLGPAGVAGGSIAGGAAGTFLGSLASDALTGDDLEYDTALKEAAISTGIDVATLGLTKMLPKGWLFSKIKDGYSMDQIAKELEAMKGQIAREGGDVGSQESLAASQNLLEQHGATLLPYQTNNASKWQKLQQKIAETGLLSQGVMQGNVDNTAAAIEKMIQETMEKGVNRASSDVATSADLGAAIYDAVDIGKEALSAAYVVKRNELLQQAGSIRIPTKAIKAGFTRYLNENSNELGSMLFPKTENFLYDLINRFGDLKTVDARSLLELEKKVRAETTAMLKAEGFTKTQVDAQITGLTKTFEDLALNAVKRKGGRGKNSLYTQYKDLKTTYARSLDRLSPKLTQRFFDRAAKGDYDQIGRLLVDMKSPTAVRSMYNSIDEAYRLMDDSALEGLIYQSSDEVKGVVKQAYLRTLLPSDGVNLKKNFEALHKRFANPDEMAKMRIILGEDLPRVKQIANLLVEATKRDTSNLGDLVIRSKEYAAAAALGTGAFLSSPGLLVGGIAIFAAPRLMARAATNPKTIRKLIDFEAKKFTTTFAKQQAFHNVATDIIADLTVGERNEIMADPETPDEVKGMIEMQNALEFGSVD